MNTETTDTRIVELPSAARRFFVECGRRGGYAGDPRKKALAPAHVRLIAQVNATRRTYTAHNDGKADRACVCAVCKRYMLAKAALDKRKARKDGRHE